MRVRQDMKNDQYLRNLKILSEHWLILPFAISLELHKSRESIMSFDSSTFSSITDLTTVTLKKTFRTHSHWCYILILQDTFSTQISEGLHKQSV